MRPVARTFLLSSCAVLLACNAEPLGGGGPNPNPDGATGDARGNPADASPTTVDLALGCEGLDEHFCKNDPACAPSYCGCNPPGLTFRGCYLQGQTPPCPATPCPPADCAAFHDAKSCDASGFCHSVYLDADDLAYGGTGCLKDCAPSACCTDYNRCVFGAKADCKGPALCNRVPPRCYTPYLTSFTGRCYEGCVLPAECQ